MHPDTSCRRGSLVSVEGISGAGKTYLTQMLTADLAKRQAAPVVTEDFSARRQPGRRDLGRDLLRVLVSASGGDKFLRGGHPAAETLLLLAIKMYDYETSIPQLARGHVVIEGRSLHTTAVYQSLILCPGNAEALTQAREILQLAGRWRPLPDITILITDDTATAINRAERRDNRVIADDERRIHHRAAALYEQLAADDPEHIRVLNRRLCDTATALHAMREWISEASGQLSCLPEPWAVRGHCTGCCRLRDKPAAAGTIDAPPGN
jgi:dTMP kinase